MADDQQLWGGGPGDPRPPGHQCRRRPQPKEPGQPARARRRQRAGPAPLEASHVPGLEAGRPRVPQRPARLLPAGDWSVRLTGTRTRPQAAAMTCNSPMPSPPFPSPDNAVLGVVVANAIVSVRNGEASAEEAILHAAVHGWYEGHIPGEDECPGCGFRGELSNRS